MAAAGRAFRDYGAAAPARVGALYVENHARQTLDFVQAKRAEFLPARRRAMGIFEALGALSAFVDAAPTRASPPGSASTRRVAASTRCTSPGDTTSTCTACCASTCPSRPST